MTRIAGMAGNRGRNLLNIDRVRPGGAELAVILTNAPDAPIIESAAERGIPTEVVELGEDESRRAHERRVLEALDPYEFELVCLDGYMRILSDTFLDAVPTTLNVHPSLLPAFPGMDAWGDALEAGVSVTGCTVHVVTDATDEAGAVIEEAIDMGPIVTQEPIPVHGDDTRETLKDRVLHEGEFRAYPRAVRWFAEGRLAIETEDGEPTAVAVEGDIDERFPLRRLEAADRVAHLRYGENPHQAAALYGDPTVEEPSVAHARQVSGDKGMSYVNHVDAAGALDLVTEYEAPAAAVIKHANPAGCATADTLAAAYDAALSTDPMSAFGGIVALNRPCDEATAERIVDSVKHVVVAPGFEGEALSILGERESMRVLDVSGGEPGAIGPADRTATRHEYPIVGGRLVQDRDQQRLEPGDLEVVTERTPTPAQRETMRFAWQVVKHATSNAIVLAEGTETVGLGIGQVSRVDAVDIAARKAREHAEGKGPAGSVMASDAFFPFPDGVEVAAEAGVEAVVQPGGSMRDDEVIAVADELGLAMAFTGQRCFRH